MLQNSRKLIHNVFSALSTAEVVNICSKANNEFTTFDHSEAPLPGNIFLCTTEYSNCTNADDNKWINQGVKTLSFEGTDIFKKKYFCSKTDKLFHKQMFVPINNKDRYTLIHFFKVADINSNPNKKVLTRLNYKVSYEKAQRCKLEPEVSISQNRLETPVLDNCLSETEEDCSVGPPGPSGIDDLFMDTINSRKPTSILVHARWTGPEGDSSISGSDSHPGVAADDGLSGQKGSIEQKLHAEPGITGVLLGPTVQMGDHGPPGETIIDGEVVQPSKEGPNEERFEDDAFNLTLQPDIQANDSTPITSESELDFSIKRKRNIIDSGDDSDREDINMKRFKNTLQHHQVSSMFDDNSELIFKPINERERKKWLQNNPSIEKPLQCDGEQTNYESKTYQFNLTAKEFASIAPDKMTALRGEWSDLIYERFRQLWPRCSLTFYYNNVKKNNSRKRNSPYWTGKAKCKIENCIHVTFNIIQEPNECDLVPVHVNISGNCNHGDGDNISAGNFNSPNNVMRHKRFLKGTNRKLFGEMLSDMNATPKNIQNQKLCQMTDEECKAGNLSFCQTPNVISQAGLEKRKAQQLHNNVISELDIQMECWDAALPGDCISGYIQSLQIRPFCVTYFTEKQMKLFIDQCKTKDCILHMDSTGSVVKSVPGNKKPYIYTLLLGQQNIPVFEFIATDHRSFSISNNLNFFLAETRKLNNGREILPHIIVTDSSFALINAVLSSFNKMTLLTYLEKIFKLLQRPVVLVKNLTILCLCSCHIIKAVSKRLYRSEKNKKIREAALVVFAKLQRSSSLQEAINIYVNSARIFTSELLTNDVQTAIDDLLDEEEFSDEELFVDFELIETPESNESNQKEESIRKKSPFTHLFGSAVDKVLSESLSNEDSEDSSNLEKNEFYSLVSFEILKSYIYSIPLWSNVVVCKENEILSGSFEKSKTNNNGIIESYFKTLKYGTMGKKKGVRPREYLCKNLVFIQGKLKENLLPKSTKTAKVKPVMDDVLEKWSKRPKKCKSKYGNPTVIKRIFKKSKGQFNNNSNKGKGQKRKKVTKGKQTDDDSLPDLPEKFVSTPDKDITATDNSTARVVEHFDDKKSSTTFKPPTKSCDSDRKQEIIENPCDDNKQFKRCAKNVSQAKFQKDVNVEVEKAISCMKALKDSFLQKFVEKQKNNIIDVSTGHAPCARMTHYVNEAKLRYGRNLHHFDYPVGILSENQMSLLATCIAEILPTTENRIIVDVLLPEIVSRLYQEVRGISKDLADKEIRKFELRLGLYDPDAAMCDQRFGKNRPELTFSISPQQMKMQLRKNSSIVVNDINLTKDNLDTLKKNNWISSDIIDAYLSTLARECNKDSEFGVFVMDSSSGTNIMTEKFHWLFEKVTFRSFDWILIPVCFSDHWLLLAINPVQGCIVPLDSSGGHSSLLSKRFVNKFKKYMQVREQHVIENLKIWTIVPYSTTQQSDGSSCGVFVMMFAECIIKSFSIQSATQSCVKEFRKYVFQRLIDKSNSHACDVKLCLRPKCGKLMWVQCDNCHSWLHQICAQVVDDVQKKDYCCDMCIKRKSRRLSSGE